MDHANFVWRQLELKVPELLTDIGYSVERADLGSDKGVYYRLRTGSLADRSTAKALCSELQGREIDCLVVRGSADQSASSPKPDAGASIRPRCQCVWALCQTLPMVWALCQTLPDKSSPCYANNQSKPST